MVDYMLPAVVVMWLSCVVGSVFNIMVVALPAPSILLCLPPVAIIYAVALVVPLLPVVTRVIEQRIKCMNRACV